MKAHVPSCAKCGADLPPEYGKVRCQYCGTETLLRRTTEQPAHQPQSAQPAQQVIQVHLGAPSRGASKAGGVLAIGIISVVLMILGGVFFAVQSRISEGAGAFDMGGLTSFGGGPQLRTRMCLIKDLDGDGVDELAGIFSDGNDGAHIPTIINGATGAPHWEGTAVSSGTDVKFLCLGASWFGVVDDADFSLTLFNSHDTEHPIRRALTDELSQYAVGEECFAFKTDDDQLISFSTGDGTEAECAVQPNLHPNTRDTMECGIVSTLPEGTHFDSGGVDFHLRPRQPGTGFLHVSASQSGAELWDETLRFVPMGGDTIGCFAGAATPDVLVVLGAPRDDDQGLVVIGLTAATGIERYATPIPGMFGGFTKSIHYNGRYVVIATVNQAIAIDPLSGAIAW